MYFNITCTHSDLLEASTMLTEQNPLYLTDEQYNTCIGNTGNLLFLLVPFYKVFHVVSVTLNFTFCYVILQPFSLVPTKVFNVAQYLIPVMTSEGMGS